MSKPKLTPRERNVFNHFESDNAELMVQLQALEDAVSEAIDVIYLDTVIGQEQETIAGRMDRLEDEVYLAMKELAEFKNRNTKSRKRIIIK